jgi:hypothetical protein
MVSPSRRQFLAATALASVSGCLGRGGGSTADGRSGDSASGATATGDQSTVPAADERLPLPVSPDRLREHAQSGGPPKNGIPSIDDPAFVGPDGASFLADGDPVFGVVRDGTAKAYPQKILAQHEICNDELAGTNVAVTYCPLTGTVQGFERGETTFGVSGRLINNNLVMYDRASETWWPQILATAIPGPWNDDPEVVSLREFRLVWTTWERWREANPETRVLSTDTGYANNYANDPYGSYNPRAGYYENDNLLFPALNTDDRHPKKAVFMGARTPDGAAAVRKSSLREERVMTGTIGDSPVVAVYDDALDTGYVYRNPEDATYEPDSGGAVGPDGTTHAPDALPLERVHTFDAMWFAWAGYYPDTNVYE